VVTAEFLTGDWLAIANDEFSQLQMNPERTCRVGVTIADPPVNCLRRVAIDIDLDSGGMRFSALPDRPSGDPRIELPYQLAMRFLLGSSLHRAEAFEVGTLRITGNLIIIYFLDRILQQSNEIRRIRARTANATADLSDECWPSSRATSPILDETERIRVESAADALPTTMKRIREEVGSSTPGALLYVSLGGNQIALAGLGEARPGLPYTAAATPQWYCCGKPLTAVAIGKLWESGKLDPFRPVADYLPRFRGSRRDSVTLAHLLTHTGPVPAGKDPLGGAMYAPYETRLRLVYQMRVRSRKRPGSQANYSAWWAWLMLAEVIEAVDGRNYDDYMRQEIITPSRLTSVQSALSPDEYAARGASLPVDYVAGGGRPAQPSYWASSRAALTECIPGYLRGTIADLGRFYEILLNGGCAPDGRLITPPTLASLTARHRTGLRDPWGGADWGLGFRLECRHIDPELTSFSRHSSPRSYGHDGMLTNLSFADPDAGLVVALHVNGKIDPYLHRARMTSICDAIYVDLGLCPFRGGR
jgi:CubicO group peptidase (beta-lactamase class C family)